MPVNREILLYIVVVLNCFTKSDADRLLFPRELLELAPAQLNSVLARSACTCHPGNSRLCHESTLAVSNISGHRTVTRASQTCTLHSRVAKVVGLDEWETLGNHD